MNRVIQIIIALECIILLSGCISTSQQFELSGTRWILHSMYGQELLGDTAITLSITEGEISGSSGCNLYGASYATRPNNRIQISEVEHTEMACLEPAGLMEQEENYISTIQKATSYNFDGENLFLVNKEGDILLEYRILPEFEANPEGLRGRTWRLMYADGMELYELSAFTLWFDGSTFRGTTSCREHTGLYQTHEDSITVTFLEMTTNLNCIQEDQISEETYTTLLERMAQYNVSQNRLELYTVQQDKLIYELASDD